MLSTLNVAEAASASMRTMERPMSAKPPRMRACRYPPPPVPVSPFVTHWATGRARGIAVAEGASIGKPRWHVRPELATAEVLRHQLVVQEERRLDRFVDAQLRTDGR